MSDRDAENEARAQLAAFAPRLADAPHTILGVAADAAPDVRRAAFLQLTKRFHPMRFARFSPDVVRQANEVFLTIKRAYDQMSAPPKVAHGTGSIPARPAGSAPPPASRQSSPAIPRPGTPPPVDPPTQPPKRPSEPFPRVVTPNPTTPPAVARPRSPLDPPTHPPPGKPSTATSAVSFTAQDRVRPASMSPATQPAPAPTARPRAASVSPTRALTPTEEAMEPAMDLLRRKLWADARQALLKLAVAHPQEKAFRAYMHYARGRESQDAGKLDEARAEWQRAIGLEPELVAAKRALEELPPEPSGGGLLGRLFGKK